VRSPIVQNPQSGLVGNDVQVSSGAFHVCIRSDRSAVSCFGIEYSGSEAEAPEPDDFISIDAGGFHNCGIRKSGKVYCWGNNDHGQASPP